MTRTAPGTERDRISAVYRTHLSTGRARLAEMLGGHIETGSRGAWLETSDGEQFLNAGGYGVFIAGARHPIVVAEVEQQLHRHPVSSRLFLEPVAARAAAALTAVTPAGATRVHFSGSGAEAAEAAIKIARLNGRDHLVSTTNGYHGKTMGALSLTAKPVFQQPFRPLLPQTAHVPFGDAAALAARLAEQPGRCCVVLEPIQAEGGVIVPPDGYLAAVRALCSEFGALLVVDEIQTGLGRTGAWWASDTESVRPDILLSGKALGGGVLPVAATVCTDELFAVLDRDPLLHTSTFSAAPLAMAAVCGALRAITEDDLVARAATIGDRLLRGIDAIARGHFGRLAEVRGRGLLIGIDLGDTGLTGELLVDLVAERVVANLSMNSDRVLRLTPPAILTDAEIDFLLERFDRAAATTARRNPQPEG